MSALAFLRCQHGRGLYPDAPPCPQIGTQTLVLHDPVDMTLSSVPIRICDEHLAAIATESTPTHPGRVAAWEQEHPHG